MNFKAKLFDFPTLLAVVLMIVAKILSPETHPMEGLERNNF
jgi:hypothetical protein